MFVYVALISLAISIIIPVGWVFMASFKKNSEFLGGDISPWDLPKSLNLDNFVTAFNDAGMGQFFANSVIVTAIGLVLLLVLALPAAIEIIKYGIVMGWSMDEARKEVKSLLKGEDIPLLPGKSEGVKLKYQSFLDSFLVIASGKLPVRMVKLIEQNIKLRYYQGFRADSMYAGVNGEVSVKTMPRIFRLAFLDGIVQRKTDNWEAGLQLSQSLCRE